jgi:outer membrane protein TolC
MRDRASVSGLALAVAAVLAFALASIGAMTHPRAQPAADVERLTLDEAIGRARVHNPDALVAAAEVRRAEALVAQVRASALPSVSPQATYARLDGDRVLMGQVIQSKDQFNAIGGIVVPLIVPQRWAQWAHAADGRRIAELSVEEVRRRVAIATAHAYLTVIVQRLVIAADTNARDAARVHAAFAEKQYEGGAVSRLDAVRAEQQWHVAEAQLNDAEIGLVRAREALGILLGGDRPIDVAETPRFPLPSPSTPSAAGGGGALGPEQLRADILAQAMRRIAADHQVRDSWTDFTPYLIGRFDPQFTDPPTIFQPRYAWQAQVQLVWPLFEGGLRYGQIRERRALLAEASTGFDAIVRAAYSDLRSGFEAVRRAEARVREAAAAAKLGHDALDIANLRYREGAATNIDVIDAERQARDADISAALAEDNERQARLDLLAAAGRFP